MPYHVPPENLVLDTVKDLKKWALPSLLSKSPTSAEINPLGAFITSVAPHPDILETEIAIRDVMPTHSDGASVFKWAVRAATAQEIEDRQPFQTFEEARVAMLEWINDFLSPFTMDAGDAEPLSWIKKEAAAKAYLAGTATTDQSDMIETEAAVDGEIPADLCAAIVAQGGLYTKVIAATTGLRRKTLTTLETASLPSEFTAILDGAKVQANAMMQQLSQEGQ